MNNEKTKQERETPRCVRKVKTSWLFGNFAMVKGFLFLYNVHLEGAGWKPQSLKNRATKTRDKKF
jgi:hypothetical protein